MLKCLQERVSPAQIKQPYGMPWTLQPPGLARCLREQAAQGSAEWLLAYLGGKHELWLGPTGCRHGTEKATTGMEKEKPICEIQQLK